jgi:hypothetical protein
LAPDISRKSCRAAPEDSAHVGKFSLRAGYRTQRRVSTLIFAHLARTLGI